MRKRTPTETDMLGGCRFIVFFTLGVCCFHALEAYVCSQHYGRAGGAIVLSPDLPNEELTTAYWMYNSATKVADKNADITGHPFSGRVALNLVNYSLTISGLCTNDSGDFVFISATDDHGQQSTTQCISLLVQVVLTQSPTLRVINITHVTNESCEAWLQCSTTQDRDVSYNWTVRDKTYSGSTLQYQIRPQERDTTFKCTVANRVSEISVTKVVNCPGQQVSLVTGLVCGVVLLVVLPLIVLCWYKNSKGRGCNRRTTETGQGGDQVQNVMREAPQEQLYSSLLHGDDCVYESITGSRNNDDDVPSDDYKNVTSRIPHKRQEEDL